MALTFGTLLSSQGTDAHQDQAFEPKFWGNPLTLHPFASQCKKLLASLLKWSLSRLLRLGWPGAHGASFEVPVRFSPDSPNCTYVAVRPQTLNVCPWSQLRWFAFRATKNLIWPVFSATTRPLIAQAPKRRRWPYAPVEGLAIGRGQDLPGSAQRPGRSL